MPTIHQPPIGPPRTSRDPSPVEEWFGDAIVGLITGSVFLFVGAVVLGMASMGTAYVVVHVVGATTGLVGAWARLVTFSVSEGLSTAAAAESLQLGALVGIVVGAVRSRRRWRKHHGEWIAEALLSPETLTAMRVGLASVAVSVVISVLAAWLVTAFGVHFPWPTSLGGHGGMVLLAGDQMLRGGSGSPGGGGPPGGWDPEAFLSSLIFAVLFISIAVGVIVALVWSGVAWLLVPAAVVRGAAFGGGGAAAGVLMQITLAGRLSRHRSAKEEWFAPAIFHGILIGAANGVIYTLIITAGAAAFGIQAPT